MVPHTDAQEARLFDQWGAEPHQLAGHDDESLRHLLFNLRAYWSLSNEGLADTASTLDRLLRAIEEAAYRGVEVPAMPDAVFADAAGQAALGRLDGSLLDVVVYE